MPLEWHRNDRCWLTTDSPAMSLVRPLTGSPEAVTRNTLPMSVPGYEQTSSRPKSTSAYRVAGGSHPPPAPTERSVRMSG